MHLHLVLCTTGLQLNQAWTLACRQAHTSKSAMDVMQNRVAEAAHEYWAHRCRCENCRMEYVEVDEG
ncbi:MAG: hypothetical protein GYA58_03370 [Anaerolineaceae bacterium]|nr:hypothetical protein [Anaerolineaceae bacterium]